MRSVRLSSSLCLILILLIFRWILFLIFAPRCCACHLQKSSSSISSQSSNNSNLTTAAQASNTHRSAGKISLHAIVGPESSSSSLSSSSLSAVWAKQADLYGQLPGGVGGSGGAGAGDADVAVAPPTQLRDLESFRHYNDDDDDLR